MLDGRFVTLSEQEMIHETCFEAWQLATGQSCGVCGEPLWRRGDGDGKDSGAYGRKTCKIRNKTTGKRDMEVHGTFKIEK